MLYRLFHKLRLTPRCREVIIDKIGGSIVPSDDPASESVRLGDSLSQRTLVDPGGRSLNGEICCWLSACYLGVVQGMGLELDDVWLEARAVNLQTIRFPLLPRLPFASERFPFRL